MNGNEMVPSIAVRFLMMMIPSLVVVMAHSLCQMALAGNLVGEIQEGQQLLAAVARLFPFWM